MMRLYFTILLKMTIIFNIVFMRSFLFSVNTTLPFVLAFPAKSVGSEPIGHLMLLIKEVLQ